MLLVVIFAAAFIAVTTAGVIALLCAGIAREEADMSLGQEPATCASALTRRIVNLHGEFRP
jgi:hypothetical protein